MELIRETMQQWYMVLSQISFSLSVPIKQVADGIKGTDPRKQILTGWKPGVTALLPLDWNAHEKPLPPTRSPRAGEEAAAKVAQQIAAAVAKMSRPIFEVPT